MKVIIICLVLTTLIALYPVKCATCDEVIALLDHSDDESFQWLWNRSVLFHNYATMLKIGDLRQRDITKDWLNTYKFLENGMSCDYTADFIYFMLKDADPDSLRKAKTLANANSAKGIKCAALTNDATFKEGRIYNVMLDPELNRHRFDLIVTNSDVYMLNSWVGIYNLKDFMDRQSGYKWKKDAFKTLWGNYCAEDEKSEYQNKLFFPDKLSYKGAPLKKRDVHVISDTVTDAQCESAFGSTKAKLQEILKNKLQTDLLYIFRQSAIVDKELQEISLKIKSWNIFKKAEYEKFIYKKPDRFLEKEFSITKINKHASKLRH